EALPDGFVLSSRRRHTSSKRDWSSDVCSSDLTTRARAVTTKILATAMVAPMATEGRTLAPTVMAAIPTSTAEAPTIMVQTPMAEIGRASCRERVDKSEWAGNRNKKRTNEMNER